MIKYSEKKIQDHIWNNRDKWSELFLPFPKLKVSKAETKISKLLKKVVYSRAETAHKRIVSQHLCGCEIALKQEGDSIIRADFIGHEIDSSGIGIIELKKSKQTERQTFTELFAYMNHFKTRLYASGKKDISLAIIAPMECRIIREAYCYSLVFDDLPIMAYEPVFSTGIESLKLKPVLPTDGFYDEISSRFFRNENFSTYHIVWMKDEEYWNSFPDSFNRLSGLCAIEMEKRGLSGFCFGQEFESDEFQHKNGLVIAGLNPWSLAFCKLLDESGTSKDVSTTPRNDWFFLRNILKVSKREIDESSLNILENQHQLWGENLFCLGRDLINKVSINKRKNTICIDQGQFNWGQFLDSGEIAGASNFDIHSTGLIKDLFWEYLIESRKGSDENLLQRSSRLPELIDFLTKICGKSYSYENSDNDNE